MVVAVAARVAADLLLGSGETLELRLRRALHQPLGPVRRVERVAEDSFTTRHVRAVVHLAAGGQREVFVKTPSGAPLTRLLAEMAGLTAAETRFYRTLATHVPVRVPACLHARHDGTRFLLVLEDLTGKAQLPSGKAACTAPQALAVINALADLHAFGWGRPARTTGATWLRAQAARERSLGAWLGPALMRRGLARAGDQVPTRLAEGAMRYARHRRRADARMTEPPETLIHNDCHSGNLGFGADGVPVLLDWQMVRAGQWARDVAYFCSLALAPEDRRAGEGVLLERYRRRLAARGGPLLDADEAHDAYRRHAAYAFEAVVVTMAIGAAAPEITRVWLARAVAAVEDLHSFAALDLPA